MLFVGEITGGKFQNSGLGEYIKSSKDGNYSIEVKKGSKRTLLQNGYYWAIMSTIGKELGCSSDDMHEIFKGIFLCKEIYLEKMKSRVFVTRSTTDLTTQEFMEYMDSILDYCAGLGIVLPPYENQE